MLFVKPELTADTFQTTAPITIITPTPAITPASASVPHQKPSRLSQIRTRLETERENFIQLQFTSLRIRFHGGEESDDDEELASPQKITRYTKTPRSSKVSGDRGDKYTPA